MFPLIAFTITLSVLLLRYKLLPALCGGCCSRQKKAVAPGALQHSTGQLQTGGFEKAAAFASEEKSLRSLVMDHAFPTVS